MDTCGPDRPLYTSDRTCLQRGWRHVAPPDSRQRVDLHRHRQAALPLALFVAAWYLNQLEGYLPLVSALLVYGVFGTVFRTAALIARRSRSFLLGAGLWFLGTVPAVLVLPATRLPAVGPDEPIPPKFVDIGTALPFAKAVPGGASAVAVGAPIAATVAYALWRLVRSLW